MLEASILVQETIADIGLTPLELIVVFLIGSVIVFRSTPLVKDSLLSLNALIPVVVVLIDPLFTHPTMYKINFGRPNGFSI